MRRHLFIIIMLSCLICLVGCYSKEQTVIKNSDVGQRISHMQQDDDPTLGDLIGSDQVEASELTGDEETTYSIQSSKTPRNMIQLTADDWVPFVEYEDADEAQAVIDQYPELASTANTGVFDPYSNKSHHFVGHVYGAFAPVLQLNVGDIVTVYDDFGRPYQYEIDFKQRYSYKDPDLAFILNDLIQSQGPGIVLQTCANLSQSKLYFLHGSLL